MTVALERGVLYADGRELATYDAATGTVQSAKRLSTHWHKPIAEAIGSKPRFIFGAGLGSPVVQGKSGEAQPVVAASPDSAPRDVEPARDPRLGDRTPAWAEWLQRNDPQGYAKRYRLESAFPRRVGEPTDPAQDLNEQPWELNYRYYDPYKSADRAVRMLYGGGSETVRR